MALACVSMRSGELIDVSSVRGDYSKGHCYHPLEPLTEARHPMDRTAHIAQRIVGARIFEYGIIALILASGALLGLATSPAIVDQYGDAIAMGNRVILGVFIVEAALKMLALAPTSQRYFRDGWNVFDFAIIVFALVPATGSFAMVARLGRLLRVLRLISAIKELRLIVGALVRSIPSVANIMMLMSIVVYIYAIVGYHLFHEADPTHWRTLGISLLSLFRVITLEDWTDIMYAAMEHHGLAWLYFLSFVVGGTFVVANLFIAVVINNLDKAKVDQLKTLEEPPSREELLRELRTTQETLRRLEDRLSGYGGEGRR